MSPGDQGCRAASGSSDSTPWTPNSTGAERVSTQGFIPTAHSSLCMQTKRGTTHVASTHGGTTRGPFSQCNEVPTQAAAWRASRAASQRGLCIV